MARKGALLSSPLMFEMASENLVVFRRCLWWQGFLRSYAAGGGNGLGDDDDDQWLGDRRPAAEKFDIQEVHSHETIWMNVHVPWC